MSWPICQLLAAAEIQGRAKLGICTKVHGETNTSGGKKYSLKNLHSTAVQKIKNSPIMLEPREEWPR